MKYLLLGGANSVGKSEAIYRVAQKLITSGYSVSVGPLPASFIDFRIILDGIDKTGKNIRILINSATDTVDIINDLKLFYDKNFPIDIIISSVRDDDFWPRPEFFAIMNIVPTDFVLEIPLAKITRRFSNFSIALTWYESTLDSLVAHTLSNPPFNI